MRETGMAPGAVMANGNPFAAAPQSANPFRAMAAPQPVNPFALGSNPTALPAPYAPPMGFAPQQPAGSAYAPPAPADRKSTRRTPVTNAQLVCRLLLEKKNNNTPTRPHKSNTR